MQQYDIDNCQKCIYFIFDITGTLYIDDSSEDDFDDRDQDDISVGDSDEEEKHEFDD